MMTNQQQTRTENAPTSIHSAQCRIYHGFKWLPLGLGKFHQDILQSGPKIKVWRSGIGVLVVWV